MSSTQTVAVDTAAVTRGGSTLPRSAQRKPSTTPTIGLSAYKGRHWAGTIEVGYATGVANSQICATNGNVYRMSLYLTLSAESHSPTESAVITASSVHSGIVRNDQRGTTP